jgi:hypothetical protein
MMLEQLHRGISSRDASCGKWVSCPLFRVGRFPQGADDRHDGGARKDTAISLGRPRARRQSQRRRSSSLRRVGLQPGCSAGRPRNGSLCRSRADVADADGPRQSPRPRVADPRGGDPGSRNPGGTSGKQGSASLVSRRLNLWLGRKSERSSGAALIHAGWGTPRPGPSPDPSPHSTIRTLR